MSREEYLQKAKDRALRYLDAGNPVEAVTSMLSDLSQHPELKEHAGHHIGDTLLAGPMINNTEFVRRYIVGYR
jgi:hypothetical protein